MHGLPRNLQEEINNMENAQDTDSEDLEHYIEEERNTYNVELDAIQDLINDSFLPDPLELIDYLLEKLNTYNSSLDILFDMQDFQRKTCLLYVIEDFRETFNLEGSTNEIIEGFIRDKLTQINKLDVLDRCLAFYKNYRHVILTRLLS